MTDRGAVLSAYAEAARWRRDGLWAWVPHTSGVVPFWNSEPNRLQLQQLFSDLKQIIFVDRQKSS